jgi:hypothetical protein
MESEVDNLGKRIPVEERMFHQFYNRERKYCMTLPKEELEKRLIKIVLDEYHVKFRKAAVLDEIAVRSGKEAKHKTRILG